MAKQIKKTVLFVGAGASRACGYPVTDEILPAILTNLEAKSFTDELLVDRQDELLTFLRRLLPGGSQPPLPLVTEILSVIDHCLDNGQELVPEVGPKAIKLRDARWLLERAMARVIRKEHSGAMQPKAIVDWILAQRKDGNDVAVISTNYDVSLDCALFNHAMDDWYKDYARTDFGFTWRDPDDGALVHPSADPLVRLYKLHGSLNWLACGRCGHIYVNFAGSIADLADRRSIYSQCECGHEPLRAVLVAPSYVRQYRDGNILSLWRSSVEALRTADAWVFVGYSLPPEDVGIRALLMRALLARSKSPDVSVVSRDSSSEPRYRQLFPNCQYTGDGLKAFLKDECQWN